MMKFWMTIKPYNGMQNLNTRPFGLPMLSSDEYAWKDGSRKRRTFRLCSQGVIRNQLTSPHEAAIDQQATGTR